MNCRGVVTSLKSKLGAPFPKRCNVMQDFDFSAIRQIRREKHLTIEGLAQVAGLTYSTLARIEQNKSVPSVETVCKVANAFELSYSDLVALCLSEEPARFTCELHNDQGCISAKAEIPPLSILGEQMLKGFETHYQREAHGQVWELLLVLEGQVDLLLYDKRYPIKAGEGIRFDGVFEHSYIAVEDSWVFCVHLKKGLVRPGR